MDDDWLVVHAKRGHIFTQQYLPIELELYMSLYMKIKRGFITPLWECALRLPYNPLRQPICNLDN